MTNRFIKLIVAVMLILIGHTCLANTENKGEIRFAGIDGKLLTNVEKHVRLVKRLRSKEGPTMLDGERRRLEARAVTEIKQALEPFGYYRVNVTPDLTEAPEKYNYRIQLNEPVRVNRVDIDFNPVAESEPIFKTWLKEYPLKEGGTLDQAAYTAAKKSLISRALSHGYFDARLMRHQIAINAERTQADVFLVFDSGPRYKIGGVVTRWNIEDEKYDGGVQEDILRTLITIKEGDYFSSQALSETQRKLLTTTYFTAVDVRSGDRDKASGEVPLEITLTPNKRQAYSATLGVGTDTGVRGSVGYENRRVNRKGHHLNARVGGSEIERIAILNYRIPLARSAQDSRNFFATLDEEFGDNRRFQSSSIGAERSRKWGESLLKYGLTASHEKFTRLEPDPFDTSLTEVEKRTDLIMPGASWEHNKADDLYFPTKGWSASVALRGASKSLGSDIDLAQGVVTAKYLRQLGSGRFKLRFKLASSLIDDATDLPESLGFLAGGDDSIRGYKYESIGVERDGRTTIAKNLTVGSIEYQHPIRDGLSLAGFFDAGDAFDDNPDFKKGAGIGLRWRLPFGALRLDAASALDLDGDPIRLHFSFGTDL